MPKETQQNSSGITDIMTESNQNTEQEIANMRKDINALQADDDTVSPEKLPLIAKIYGILSIILGGGTAVMLVLAIMAVIALNIFADVNLFESWDVSTQAAVLNCVNIAVALILACLYTILGIRILMRKRRGAARLAYVMGGFAIAVLLLDLMTKGIGYQVAYDLISLIILIFIESWLDPSLRQERQLQRKLSALEDRAADEAGTLGRDTTGEGYISLNFFNIFWIFVICSILGLLIESTVCPFLNGRIENRTGMLWGPFSPIYGVGALLMTIALNRFWNKNPLLIFSVSAVIGGAFEFAASWFFQFAFGIVAWDYSGEFMNFDGRTDLFHMICWGILGLVWIRFLLPRMLKLVNRIPWNWRYGVTAVCTTFMIVNAVMTMLSFDCWYLRVGGVAPDTPVAEFFDEHYDDEFMAEHFATMSIDPSRATRD